MKIDGLGLELSCERKKLDQEMIGRWMSLLKLQLLANRPETVMIYAKVLLLKVCFIETVRVQSDALNENVGFVEWIRTSKVSCEACMNQLKLKCIRVHEWVFTDQLYFSGSLAVHLPEIIIPAILNIE